MRHFVNNWVEENQKGLIHISDKVWEFAELGLAERPVCRDLPGIT